MGRRVFTCVSKAGCVCYYVFTHIARSNLGVCASLDSHSARSNLGVSADFHSHILHVVCSNLSVSTILYSRILHILTSTLDMSATSLFTCTNLNFSLPVLPIYKGPLPLSFLLLLFLLSMITLSCKSYIYTYI